MDAIAKRSALPAESFFLLILIRSFLTQLQDAIEWINEYISFLAWMIVTRRWIRLHCVSEGIRRRSSTCWITTG